MQLNLCSEFDSVAFDRSEEMIVMASLECPQVESEERQTRAPIDLCCVLDKSGSMQGAKLELVKVAMKFVIEQLKADDRLALVSFDTNVQVEHELRATDEAGKQAAQAAMTRVQAGSCTNLSGGLLRGLECLSGARGAGRGVCSLLLFTDGLANEGIRDVAEIVRAVRGGVEGVGGPCAIFTFGFGSDHDSNMLSQIADAAHGVYYFIRAEDDIPRTFGECLGGLLSVAAQNVQLQLRVRGDVCRLGATLSTTYPTRELAATTSGEEGGGVVVDIGDLYSEEKKDILFRVELPLLSGAAVGVGNAQCIASFDVSYFCAVRSQLVTERRVVEVRRGAETVRNTANLRIDQQRNRLRCTAALKRAGELADGRQFAEARAELQCAIEAVRGSLSGGEAFCVALVGDMEQAQSRLANQQEYAHEGHRYMRNMASCHGHQRCTESAWDDVTPQMAQRAYTTTTKMAMRSAAEQHQ